VWSALSQVSLTEQTQIKMIKQKFITKATTDDAAAGNHCQTGGPLIISQILQANLYLASADLT